jgi:hypothetical protein
MSEKINEKINENMECQYVDGAERRWTSSGMTLSDFEQLINAYSDNGFDLESKEHNGMYISMYCDQIKTEHDMNGRIAMIQFMNNGTTLELYTQKIEDIEYDEESKEITISTVGCSFDEITITIN